MILYKPFFLLLILLLFEPVIAQSNETLNKDIVRLGGIADMVDGVELKDAEAAFKILTNSFVKRLKEQKIYDFNFEGKMYSDLNSMQKDIENGYIQYFNVSSYDYFRFYHRKEFVPFLSGMHHPSENSVHYLLVTSLKNQKIELKQLSNQKISIPRSIQKSVGFYWLKANLRNELGAKLYKTINLQLSSQSENEDLLSLFFGKTDYVIISEGTFNVACELNPSIKSKVRIIKKSEGFLNGVFVYKQGLNSQTITAIQDIAVNLHNDTNGKQILSLFKMYKISRVKKEQLDETEKVINLYNKFFN